ncbi:MAG: aldo/keto reductase [Phycisphaerae bacterium]|nr:aldo/keto reductase [Phycisphaerae bacterium]
MSNPVNRRTFLKRSAETAAAVAGLRHLPAVAAETQPATQPALEWRNKQPTMAYAQLGRTRFMASRCVFGAAGVFKKGGDLRVLELAIERGLNYIDTCRGYGDSESAIAGLIKKHRDRLFVVSKAGHIGWPDMTIQPGQDAAAAKLYTDQLEESLRQLEVETIDCYMVQGVEHDWIVTMDALYEAFTKARKAGKVRFFGLATHTNVPQICELAAKGGRHDIVMLAVNPSSLAPLSPAIAMMHNAGVGVVSMKASGPIARDRAAFDGQTADLFAGQKLSAYQRAFAYLLFRGGIDAFNSHMPNREILEENLAVPMRKLEKAALDQIEARTLAETQGACRHCGACNRTCPQGVNVSGLLRCHAYARHYHEPDLARATYAMFGEANAAACRDCGACRAACPASIDLPAVIRGVRAAMA